MLSICWNYRVVLNQKPNELTNETRMSYGRRGAWWPRRAPLRGTLHGTLVGGTANKGGGGVVVEGVADKCRWLGALKVAVDGGRVTVRLGTPHPVSQQSRLTVNWCPAATAATSKPHAGLLLLVLLWGRQARVAHWAVGVMWRSCHVVRKGGLKKTRWVMEKVGVAEICRIRRTTTVASHCHWIGNDSVPGHPTI